MPFAAALIDLDGTLLDTVPDLADAANAMLTDLGHATLPADLIGSFIGKGTENLVKRTLTHVHPNRTEPSAPDLAHALHIFHTHYEHFNGLRSTIYPGVVEGLKAFEAAGVKLGVVTNKPTVFTQALLQRTGLDAWFSVQVCGDTCERKKPDPMPFLHACSLLGVAPDQTLAIGDSVNDALAARAAGLTVLAVPYGYNEGHSVHALDVDGIVDTLLDAAAWSGQRA